MATNSKKKGAKLTPEQAELRAARRDNIRWITGFALLSAGIYVICSIVSFFFYWREDMSAAAMTAANNPLYNPIFNNVCGSLGAKLSMALVGRGFGVFAMVVPIYLLVMGWRLFRSKEIRFLYITISSSLILILGSLTLAFIFETKWNLYGSGLGGAYGLAMNTTLCGVMGFIGTLLVILAGWILTGLFINRNFLSRVDSAGEQVADGISGAASWFMERVKRNKTEDVEDVEEEPVAEQPHSEPEEEAKEVATQLEQMGVLSPSAAVAMSARAAQSEPKSEAVAEHTPESNSPFTAVPRGTQVEVDGNGNIAVDEPQAAEPQVIDDYPFKDPEAPIEDPLTAEQIAAIQAQQTAVQTVATPNPNSPFTTVPRDYAVTSEPVEPAPTPAPTPAPAPAEVAPVEEPTDGMIITVEQPKNETIAPESIVNNVYDPMRDLYNYVPPVPTLLTDHKSVTVANDEEIFQNKERIRETLLNFGIPIRSMHATVGPTVTLYEIIQEQGVKISKIQGLENDIAQSLKALGIRIIAPIPGRGTIGIEVPNLTKQTVSMYSAICSREFQESKAQLPVVIGRTIQNENYTFDLAKMPHLLVAGATGQGKSVGLNAIITSLL